MITTRARLRGGIDLGGTKIQAVVLDGRNEVRGQARASTPRDGGPPAVAAAMAETLRTAWSRPAPRRASWWRPGSARPAPIDFATGDVSHSGNIPGWYGLVPARRHAGGRPRRAGADRQRRRRRHRGRVPPRRRQGVPVGARRLLGHRRRRRPGPERPALVGTRRGGRDRPRGRAAGRPALPVRAARLHGGVRGPRCDGGARPRGACRRPPARCCSRSWSDAARSGSRAASGRTRWPRATISRRS